MRAPTSDRTTGTQITVFLLDDHEVVRRGVKDLPDGDGVTVCRDLRSQLPELACLMLTSFADDDALYAAILAGASGYVLKQIKGSDLVNAVRTVAIGGSLLDAKTTARIMQRPVS